MIGSLKKMIGDKRETRKRNPKEKPESETRKRNPKEKPESETRKRNPQWRIVFIT